MTESESNGGEALLLIADSETNADLYYATGFLVGSAVIFLEREGRKTLFVNDLEYGRAGAEARVDRVVSTTPLEEELRRAGRPVRLSGVVDLHLRDSGVKTLTVPASFPILQADQLRELGYRLRVREEPFFPARTVKKPEELSAIEEAQRQAEAAMAHAAGILEASRIRAGVLRVDGAPLTAERLRLEIRKFLLERGYEAPNTIVACGDQGTDPHTRGSGPLHAHETIIVDIFPRSTANRYWGDMTRTFVRGKAKDEVRRLYRDVLEAQGLAFSLLRPGADGHSIHAEVARFFRERGHENAEVDGRKTGFIHGTGHGLGLEIHESPRLGRVESILAEGHVVTVEPGLYYPGTGAVRLEDVAVITADGARNLNRFPKSLEIV